jgi:hypothetical protein
VLHENQGQQCHAERLDQPIHEEGHKQAFWFPSDTCYCAEVHFEHHGINHQPQQDANGDVHLGALAEFELAQGCCEVWQELTE